MSIDHGTFRQEILKLSAARLRANTAVKTFIEEHYPDGSLIRYYHNGRGVAKVGRVLSQPADWVLDDRLRVENQATGKVVKVEPKYIAGPAALAAV